MKIHLVVAHPEKESFNFALHNTAIDVLNMANFKISISDLYEQEFNPVAGRHDVMGLPEEDFFQLAKAQRVALSNDSFTESIKVEQEKLATSDILIFQFPLWWWSFPGILKGWIDRVLSSGFAYGDNVLLKPKKVMYSLTTGGANSIEELEYYQNKIDGLYQDIFGFMGWELLPAFIAHGVQTMASDERMRILDSYKAHILKNIINNSENI